MIKIDIIGYGSHCKKNVIPAIERCTTFEVGTIYSKSKKRIDHGLFQQETRSLPQDASVFSDWVYLTVPIWAHFQLSKWLIGAGKNVICEKPLTPTQHEARILQELAQNAGTVLHEVDMYKHHRQFDVMTEAISGRWGRPKYVRSAFQIPHLASSDIRYKSMPGGGALHDVGFYPLNLAVSLFGAPTRVESIRRNGTIHDVNLTGVALLEFGGCTFVGEWGIGLPYKNEVTIFSEDHIIEFNRPFSKPPNLTTECRVTSPDEVVSFEIMSDDQFVNMLDSLVPRKCRTDLELVTLQTLDIIEKIING